MANRAQLASTNVLFGLVSNIVTLILGFVSRAVFVRVLGAEMLGIEAVFTNLIQMLSLADLGLMSVMTFSYYKPLAEKDHIKVKALIAFYRKLYLGIAIVVAILGIALVPFLPFILNIEQDIPNLVLFYLLFVADSVISYLFVYRTTILRADQKNYIISKYEIITNIARTIVQIGVLLLFSNYVIYLVVRIVFTWLWNFLAARQAAKDYPNYFGCKEKLSRESKREILSILKSGFIYKVSAVFLTSTTNVILSIVVGTVTVGYLSNYNLIATSIVQLVAIVFTNLIASVGNLAILENNKMQLNVFKSMASVSSWLAIVFVTCATVLCQSFIILWVGNEYVLPLHTEILRMAWMFFECIMQPVFTYREAVGLYRKTRYVMLMAAVLNIGLGFALGCMWGIDGVLVAAICSRVLTYFWYEPKVLFHDYFQASPSVFFLSVALALLITSGCSLAGLVIVQNFVCDSWAIWIVEAFVVFVATNVICALIYWKRPEIKSVYNVFKSLIKKN